jgi:hypothetical protein
MRRSQDCEIAAPRATLFALTTGVETYEQANTAMTTQIAPPKRTVIFWKLPA